MIAARCGTREEATAAVLESLRADARLREHARRRLQPAQRLRLGIEIVVTHALVRRRIAALPLPQLLVQLRRGVIDEWVPAACAPAEHVTAVRLARAVRRVLHRLPGDTRCLTQSLVLTTVLARRGIGSTLRIAVSPGQVFKAHAWVEHGGVPLLPAEDPGFGELVEL